jgi:hypothetical protein
LKRKTAFLGGKPKKLNMKKPLLFSLNRELSNDFYQGFNLLQNHWKSQLFCILLILGSVQQGYSQNFSNGSFTGTKGVAVAATGWAIVLSTPDVNDITGPAFTTPGYVWSGGTPIASPDGGTWQNTFSNEAVSQTVTGLTIGKKYSFSYYYATQAIASTSFTFNTPQLPNVTITGATGYTNPTSAGTIFQWQLHTSIITATATSATFTFSGPTASGYMAYDGAALVPCNAGTTAPTLSATTKSNVCPATTADISSLVSSTCPVGSSLEWHNTNAGLNASNLVTATSVAAGTYYPVCHDVANDCYGPTPTMGVTVTINSCVDSDGDGIIDSADLDDDNDGILDSVECTGLSYSNNPGGAASGTETIVVCTNTGGTFAFDGTYMASNDAKLLNPALFGSSGIYHVNFQVVKIPTASLSLTTLNSNGCQIFQQGLSTTDATLGSTVSSITAAQIADIKTWSATQGHVVIGFQGLAASYGAYVSGNNGVTNPMTATGAGNALFLGPFGNATSGFSQGGSYKAKYSSLPVGQYCPIIKDAANQVVGFIDLPTQDIFISDVGILATTGGTTAGSGITSNNDKVFANLYASIAQSIIEGQPNMCNYLSGIPCSTDTDGDGIVNSLDLDSDGDGCSDAIEGAGAFTPTNLVASTMLGGNSGVGYTGTSTAPVTQNLGNTVNTTVSSASYGVPTIATTGQSLGDSQNGAVSSQCVSCTAGTTAPVLGATTKFNVCPATTADLSGLVTSACPATAPLEWHTVSTGFSALNKVGTPNAVSTGTYYPVCFDATNACYSPAPATGVTVSITTCSGPFNITQPAIQTVLSGSPKSGTVPSDVLPSGGTTPYVYSNGSLDPLCVAPIGATLLPVSSNLMVSSTGAYSYTAPTAAGTYYFCVKVCDSATPTPTCTIATYKITVTAPVTITQPAPQTSAPNALRTGVGPTDLIPNGGLGALTYTNGSLDPLCVAPVGATPLPASSNLMVVASTGAYSYTTPSVPGTYYFCVKVCDSSSPTPSCAIANYKVTVTAPAFTVIQPSVQTGLVNTPKSGNAPSDLTPVGGVGAYVYSNGSTDPACTPLSGAMALPASSNLSISITGAYSYTTPTTAGTYYFCVKVCDSATPTPSCAFGTYKVVVSAPACAAGTVAPGVN